MLPGYWGATSQARAERGQRSERWRLDRRRHLVRCRDMLTQLAARPSSPAARQNPAVPAVLAAPAVPAIAGLRLALLAVALAGAVGCGDDDSAESELLDNMGYRSPLDMPRGRCVPGSLAGVAPVGLYHGYAVGDGTRFDLTARVAASDRRGELTGAIGGFEAQLVHKTNDDLFVRSAQKDSLRALNWCGVNAAGELVGSYVRCTDRGCLLAELTGKSVVPLAEASAHNLTLLGETSGDGRWSPGITVNVRVKDGLAYLARYGDGLRIVDVRNPANLVQVGHLPVESTSGEIYNDVKLVDGPLGKRYALMASNLKAVVVVDVTNPAAPTIAGHFGSEPERSSNVHTLAVDGTRAYLANTSAGLDIYDITVPTAPVKRGTFSHPAGRGYLHDLYVSSARAYLNWWTAGFAIVDVSAPAAPALLGSFSGYGEVTSHSSWVTQVGGRTIALHGDEQYGARLHVVDVTEGSQSFARSLATWMTRPEVSIHNVMAMGHLAILAYYHDGVRVVDLSDPTKPKQVAWFNTWRGPQVGGESFFEAAVGVDVDPAARIVYVADSVRGLLVLGLASGI